MNLEERIEKIEQSQQTILKELNLLEELMKAMLVNNALDSAEKLEQTEKVSAIKNIECRLENLEKSHNDNINLIMQKLDSLSENSGDSQNDEFKNSSEKYHKSNIGRIVKISNNCNHYFDGQSHYMELSLFANHRKRTWTIEDYRMGKYKLYWTNGSHTFQLWFDTNDVVF